MLLTFAGRFRHLRSHTIDMLRSHTCGELRPEHIGQTVTLSGWVQRARNLGGLTFVDLRDRYGITQLAFNMDTNADLCGQARKLGREFVIQAVGTVCERESKNMQIPTGEIEIEVTALTILNAADTPPFTIEDDTDGGDDLRMQYRYLDLRRGPVQRNLLLRHRINIETRKYLDSIDFIDVETPVLIKSTPEGARDFVVPSRMNPGQFYALPQSPQTFKQLLMVSGIDKYYQIVKCFRDEDLRADRQPEFTQVDCEMSFVEQEDILNTFEGLVRHLFQTVLDREIGDFPRMTYDDAMEKYGIDKPDIRFGMEFQDMAPVTQGVGFNVFDSAEAVLGIVVPGAASFTRKQLDGLTDWVKRPQIGARGLVYCKVNEDGTFKSSVDKFYDQDALAKMGRPHRRPARRPHARSLRRPRRHPQAARRAAPAHGVRDGPARPLRLQALVGGGLPPLEWDEDTERYHAMHHPFTSPKPEHMDLIDSDPGAVTRQRLRHGHQRRGNWRGLHPNPRQGRPSPHVRPARLHARRGPGPVRLPDERLPLRCTSPRRTGPRFRPPVLHARRREHHPRLHRLP